MNHIQQIGAANEGRKQERTKKKGEKWSECLWQQAQIRWCRVRWPFYLLPSSAQHSYAFAFAVYILSFVSHLFKHIFFFMYIPFRSIYRNIMTKVDEDSKKKTREIENVDNHKCIILLFVIFWTDAPYFCGIFLPANANNHWSTVSIVSISLYKWYCNLIGRLICLFFFLYSRARWHTHTHIECNKVAWYKSYCRLFVHAIILIKLECAADRQEGRACERVCEIRLPSIWTEQSNIVLVAETKEICRRRTPHICTALTVDRSISQRAYENYIMQEECNVGIWIKLRKLFGVQNIIKYC